MEGDRRESCESVPGGVRAVCGARTGVADMRGLGRKSTGGGTTTPRETADAAMPLLISGTLGTTGNAPYGAWPGIAGDAGACAVG
jgi:hypothetical protein